MRQKLFGWKRFGALAAAPESREAAFSTLFNAGIGICGSSNGLAMFSVVVSAKMSLLTKLFAPCLSVERPSLLALLGVGLIRATRAVARAARREHNDLLTVL
jgi:hypothetical protein